MMRISAGRIAKFAFSGDWGDAAREAAYAGHRWPTESLIADLKEVVCPLLPELDERPLTAAMAESLTWTSTGYPLGDKNSACRFYRLMSGPRVQWDITISRTGLIHLDVAMGDGLISFVNPTVGQFFTASRLAGVVATVAEAEWRKLGDAPAAAP